MVAAFTPRIPQCALRPPLDLPPAQRPPPPPPRGPLPGRSPQAEPAPHEPAAPAQSPTPDSCTGLKATMPQAPPATKEPAPSAPPSPQPTAPPASLANTPTTAPPRTRPGSVRSAPRHKPPLRHPIIAYRPYALFRPPPRQAPRRPRPRCSPGHARDIRPSRSPARGTNRPPSAARPRHHTNARGGCKVGGPAFNGATGPDSDVVLHLRLCPAPRSRPIRRRPTRRVSRPPSQSHARTCQVRRRRTLRPRPPRPASAPTTSHPPAPR